MTAQETTTPRTRPSKAKAQALAPKPGSEAQGAPEAAAEPEVAPESQPAAETVHEAWERLTAPLEHWDYPAFWSSAWHGECDTYRDGLRMAQRQRERETVALRRADRAVLIAGWEREHRQHTEELRAAAHQAMLATSGPAGVTEDALEPLP